MVRMEVGDENVGNVFGSKVKSRKLIYNQIFFMQCDRSHPAIKTIGEFFCLIEEAIGITCVKKHRAQIADAATAQTWRENECCASVRREWRCVRVRCNSPREEC